MKMFECKSLKKKIHLKQLVKVSFSRIFSVSLTRRLRIFKIRKKIRLFLDCLISEQKLFILKRIFKRTKQIKSENFAKIKISSPVSFVLNNLSVFQFCN